MSGEISPENYHGTTNRQSEAQPEGRLWGPSEHDPSQKSHDDRGVIPQQSCVRGRSSQDRGIVERKIERKKQAPQADDPPRSAAEPLALAIGYECR